MAHAQMGWTLEQSRQHFGREFDSHGSSYNFHVGPWARGQGEHVYLTFDPDSTVGEIQWLKLDGKPYSEAEVQRRLSKASRVTWKRTAGGPDRLNWAGMQKGKIIFRANLAENGRGTWILTITTE